MNMRKKLAAAFLVLAFLPCSVHAAEFTASKIYGKPWLVLSVSNPAESYATYSKTPLPAKVDALLALPALKENLDYQKFLLDKEKAEVQLGYPLNLKTFCEMLGGADLALYTSATGEPSPLLILKVADKDKFAKLIAELEKSKDASLTVNSSNYQGKNLNIVSRASTSAADVSPQFAWVMATDELFVLGSLEPVKQYLDSMAGGDTATVDSTMEFKQAVSGLPGKAFDSFAYMNYAAMLEAMGNAKPGDEDIFKMMRQQYGAMNFAFGKLVSSDHVELYGYVPASADSKLAEMMAKFKPAKMQSMDYLPVNNTLAFWQNTWDGEFVWNSLMETVASISSNLGADLGAADPMAQINAQIAQAEVMLGFKIKDDLLMGIGPEMFFDLGQVMGTQAELTIGFQIADVTKINKVIAGLTNLIKQTMSMQLDPSQPAPNPLLSLDFKGVKIDTINNPTFALLGYSPGFFTDGKFFVIGSSLKALQDSISISKGEMQNITSQPRYQKVFEFTGIEANQVSVIDIRSAVQSVEAIVMSFFSASWTEVERQSFIAMTDLAKTFTVAGSSSTSSAKGSSSKSVIYFE